MRVRILAIAFGTLLLSAFSASSPAAIARLELQSQAGDFIGGGGTFDIVYQSPIDEISAEIRRTLTSGEPAELLWVLDSPAPGNQFAILAFGTDALGIPIQASTYTNAQRADFAAAGHPGLDVSFQNRGSNSLTGSFVINYVTFNPTLSAIQTFKATFEQHSGGGTPALFGTFTYAASSVPEPGAAALCATATLALLHRRRRHNGVVA
ncbi:MAG: hypothetical protein JWO31_3408 [Phycisphaerales bacterium]|nr:hypothetical protein [Phycisphaerales bacterium]